MTQLIIRNVDEAIALKLSTRAAAKGRSLEAELRDILAKAAAEAPPPRNLGRSIVERFRRHGGVELDLPARTREPAPTGS
jgi:plasmid stability protein